MAGEGYVVYGYVWKSQDINAISAMDFVVGCVSIFLLSKLYEKIVSISPGVRSAVGGDDDVIAISSAGVRSSGDLDVGDKNVISSAKVYGVVPKTAYKQAWLIA